MNQDKLYREIEDTFGLVPMMFKQMPANILEIEWNLFRKTQLEDGNIPNKYRELIGIGIASAMKCQYCTYFHTAIARLYGATDAEIEEAVHFAKQTTGWSTYVNGLQLDFTQFKKEIDMACKHVKESMTEHV
ncbi:MAG: carboxymuconolactone decarboxylase family protein [Bacteroidota bacterium]